MKLYLSIDDTDDIESKGTGEIAEEIAEIIDENKIGKISAVTRHQLYIHDDIPYTSHNSSMCFEIDEVNEKDYDLIISLAENHLKKESSKLSDPGLCICDINKIDSKLLIEYGFKAKSEVLTKEYAYALAENQNIFLKEYGGTGDGIIGALAGIGLRLSGNDGRFKGKHKIKNGKYELEYLINNFKMDKIYDITTEKYLKNNSINLEGKIKTVLLDGKRVLPVFNENGNYYNCTKQQLRKY
ncbi:hypothetical protein QUF55_02925 [Clostridiaceae bacterium HSG29]|nr:hypothetical protein [Clostridiaceae bacterium HSG29]